VPLLTLILGAKCLDGVALIADTKMTGIEGTFLGHEDKISGELRNVLFGFAGDGDMINIFRRYLVGDVIILRDSSDNYTDENLLIKLKEIMLMFKRARLGQYFGLKVMVARLFPDKKTADLHVVDSNANIDKCLIHPWKIIGSGGRKIDSIIQDEWDDNMNMKSFTRLSYCVIKYIEQKQPSGSVGVGHGEPTMRYLGYDAEEDAEPPEEHKNEFRNQLEECLSNFNNKYALSED